MLKYKGSWYVNKDLEDNCGLTGKFSFKGITKKSLDIAWICRTKGYSVDNA